METLIEIITGAIRRFNKKPGNEAVWLYHVINENGIVIQDGYGTLTHIQVSDPPSVADAQNIEDTLRRLDVR